MRIVLKILCTILFVQCSTSKVNKANDCNENKDFKKVFFNSIELVESYVEGNGDRIEFEKSIDFISKYTNVSRDQMLNYNNSYTSMGDFKKDKELWLSWYEKNKCDNISMK